MQTWDVYPQRIVTAVEAATFSSPLERVFIAPGPGTAFNCRQVHVYLARPQTVPVGGEMARQFCAFASQLVFDVVFVADCVPTAQGTEIPTADELTAWSTHFVHDCGVLWDTLAELVEGGLLGECRSSSIGEGVPQGPLGTRASMRFPVTVLLTQ